MNFKLKTSLAAFLAVSAANFHGTGDLCAQGDYGIVRPAQVETQPEKLWVPPTIQASPRPAVMTSPPPGGADSLPPIISQPDDRSSPQPPIVTGSSPLQPLPPSGSQPPIVRNSPRPAEQAPVPMIIQGTMAAPEIQPGFQTPRQTPRPLNAPDSLAGSPEQSFQPTGMVGENSTSPTTGSPLMPIIAEPELDDPGNAPQRDGDSTTLFQTPVVRTETELPPITTGRVTSAKPTPSASRLPAMVDTAASPSMPVDEVDPQTPIALTQPKVSAAGIPLYSGSGPSTATIKVREDADSNLVSKASMTANGESDEAQPTTDNQDFEAGAPSQTSPVPMAMAPPQVGQLLPGRSVPPIVANGPMPRRSRGMATPPDLAFEPPAAVTESDPPLETEVPTRFAPESTEREPVRVAQATGTGLGQSYFDSTQSTGCASCGGVNGGCPDCGIAGSGIAGCASCGTNGCFDPNAVASQFSGSGAMSMARRYLIAEVLYFNRDDGVIANNNFGALNDFDAEAGWRLTLGQRSDSTRGGEFSYMGTQPISQDRVDVSPTGLIQTRFTPLDGFSPLQISGFQNAVQQSQLKETYLHSLEFNKVRWGWDVLKTFYGLRYILVDDKYTLNSQSLGGDTGFYQLDATNNLIGPHIGAELFYDVGRRWSFTLVSKAGIYGNLNTVETTLDNNGTRYLGVKDESSTFAGSYEASLNAQWKLSRNSRLRAGYNILWLGEVASVSDNFTPFITPSTGTNTNDSDDMFFYGLSFGLEVYR